ncbi:MAG: DUF6298 domain-containing protein, partial [Dehalococcoidales bacterium]|nr:DUF6298 domain-containing protein [Dehalococcoidales bacterium]
MSFDYMAYLDFMQQRNHNFMRMWNWELFEWTDADSGGINYVIPVPWLRTGPGVALDGKPKFDLTRFDQAYFDRLRSRIIAARDRGIYVSFMFFEGWALQFARSPTGSTGHPFNVNNNVNGIDGDINGDEKMFETHTMNTDSRIVAVRAIQEAYVRKVVDTVNDLDNVLYEIANEDGGGSAQWQYYMIDFIKNYEATKPDKHPVGMTYRYRGGTNAELFSSPADWISPESSAASPYDYRTNPPPADGSKVIISDTDHLWGIGGDRTWVWKSFTRGLNPIFMDPITSITGSPNPEPPNVENTRYTMGYTLTYANKMNLSAMTPRGDLTSTGYALVNPGNEYLVYQSGSGSFTVNLLAGTYSYEWFNPSSGGVVDTGSFTATSGNSSFTPPLNGDAVLYLKVAMATPTPTPTPIPIPSGNLISNPGFETGNISPWGSWQADASVSSIARSGLYGGKAAFTTGPYGDVYTIGQDSLATNATVGQIYYATAWVKGESSSIGKTSQVTIRERGSTQEWETSSDAGFKLSSSWQQISVNRTMAESGSILDVYIGQSSAVTGDYFYIDDSSFSTTAPTPIPTPTPISSPTPIPIPSGNLLSNPGFETGS